MSHFLIDVGCNGNAQLARALILDLNKGKARTQALSWSSKLYGLGAMCSVSYLGALPIGFTYRMSQVIPDLNIMAIPRTK